MPMNEDGRWDEAILYALGVHDPDRPSRTVHEDRIARLRKPFTPQERRLIRYHLLETLRGEE